MNSKRLAVYLWPLLALSSTIIIFTVMLSQRRGSVSVLENFRYALERYCDMLFVGWPYYTAPCLGLFALSCLAWLYRQNILTFFGIILTASGLLGWPGMNIIAALSFRGFGSM